VGVALLPVKSSTGPRRGAAVSSSSNQVTELLARWGDGDEDARETLIPVVYQFCIDARSRSREGDARGGTSVVALARSHVLIRMRV
jgi:hypothetical protein